MKTSAVGIIAVTILLVATGIGFGIAQAGGSHSDAPVSSFEDQEALEPSRSSSPVAEKRPALGIYYRGLPRVADSLTEDMKPRNPIETGSLPDGNDADFDPFSRGGSD